MIDRIRNLKITDIFFLILLSCFFIFLMTAEREGPENMREQIAQHEPWLTNTSNYISDYMNEPKSDLWISNNGANFTSIYSSPRFSPEKLEGLRVHLLKMDWSELPPQDSTNNEELVAWLGQPLTNTVILCQNKTAIIIWKDNLKEKYGNTFDMKTMIRLLFDYRTPCFDLNTDDTK